MKRGNKTLVFALALVLLVGVVTLAGTTIAWFEKAENGEDSIQESEGVALSMSLQAETDASSAGEAEDTAQPTVTPEASSTPEAALLQPIAEATPSPTPEPVVEIQMNQLKNGSWTRVEGLTPVFNQDEKLMPGHLETVFLQAENTGNLPFTYQLTIATRNLQGGTSVKGNTFKVSDLLQMGAWVVTEEEIETFDTRARMDVEPDVMQPLSEYADTNDSLVLINGRHLEVGKAEALALVLYMPETIGNEANYRGATVPKVEISVRMTAMDETAQLLDMEANYGAPIDQDALDSLRDSIEEASN